MARRESAAIIAAAEAEAARIYADAEVSADKARREMTAAALADAARRREMLLASVPAEAGKLRLARQEAMLEAIKAEALARLPSEAASAGKTAVLASLAAQAVSCMEGDKFSVALAADDKAAAAGLSAEIERLVGRGPLQITIEERPGPGGGVIVRDGEGRQYWDNSFKARLERSWPELRGQLLPGAAREEK
jgi:vacuolar-type H+-ATPase subunit E/Vma4